MNRVLRAASVMVALASGAVTSQTLFEDRLEILEPWSTFQSAGVQTRLLPDEGYEGRCLRMDVAFTKGSGYGGIVRDLDVPLPENYRLVFMLRGDVPVNDFEVKISSDKEGENIWWVNTRKYEYPSSWRRFVLKKRHFTFAWGPRPSPYPDTLRRLELVVTAGNGGKGSIWVDNIEVQAIRPPPDPLPKPRVRASSSYGSASPDAVLPDVSGEWRSRGSRDEWLEIDLGYPREFSGVKLDWVGRSEGLEYSVLGSTDGEHFDTLHAVHGGAAGTRVVHTPDAEASIVRFALLDAGTAGSFRLRNVEILPSDSLPTRNAYLESLSASSPRGTFPRYFSKEKSYWTIAGVDDGRSEALLNEDGVWEAGHFRFSLEPFIVTSDGSLLTWNDAQRTQSLADGYLPIPSVMRLSKNLALSVTLLAEGSADRSTFMARYVVRNVSNARQSGSFFVTIRPFQVNPTYQWLNTQGGVANIKNIRIEGNRARVDSASVIVSGSPSASGSTHLDAGDIVSYLSSRLKGTKPSITDENRFASAAFAYDLDLASGDSLVVVAAVPVESSADRWNISPPTDGEYADRYRHMREWWRTRLNTVSVTGPAEVDRLFRIIRSNIAYVLINKDGHGIQPGSRSYERSWIRDGSMTSSALLKFGETEDVKDFLTWYASFQYENGMVPCVVDWRGPDPTPENDSHGQLIFGLMEYFRFTHDTSFIRANWDRIVSAVEYIQQLRGKRMTAEYADGPEEKRAFYGLVPASISHEGYSAKPMHSYWDDFFVLKGLKDAAEAAAVIGESNRARIYDSLSVAFRGDLYSSIRLAMRLRDIAYIPGCVELGDFDATSTSIALFPGGELSFVPQPAFRNTFEKYFTWFREREWGREDWSGYTPYEIRNVGTYVYLGQRERAHELLDWFLGHQRPHGWNHWAEVVWKDERHPGFIGDMPHTWVGSDFMNAVRAMFVYEVQDDRSLTVGAGIRSSWLDTGISVAGLPTHFGVISYSARKTSDRAVLISISGDVDPRQHAVRIAPNILPFQLQSARLNGTPAQVLPDGSVSVSTVPAHIILQY